MDQTVANLLKYCEHPSVVEVEARIKRQLITANSIHALLNCDIQWEQSTYTERKKISKTHRKCTYRQRVYNAKQGVGVPAFGRVCQSESCPSELICKSSIAKEDFNDMWCTVHVSIETPVPSMMQAIRHADPIKVCRYRAIIDGHYVDIIENTHGHNVYSATLTHMQLCESENSIMPGDPIGIRSIQSIMMSATQMNLSHFHTAGMSSSGILGGVRAPSAADAMNSIYTKNNTSMKFTTSALKSTKNTNKQLRYFRKHLVGASLGDFVRKIGSNITELNPRENIWYTAKENSSCGPSEIHGVLLRIYIDYNKMYNHGLTLENLAQEIFGNDCSWNVSPDFMGMIDISVPDTHISQWLSRIKNRVCGTSDVLSCDLLGQSDSDTFSDSDGISPRTSAAFLENCLSRVSKYGTFFTRGTNVLAACKTPGINKSTIELNNVISVEKHFGIEAAAKILASLTGNVIVSDFMARTGRVLPFSKHSNEVSNKGLLTSMGFERPKDDIQREINTLGKQHSLAKKSSVYEHIITGKDPPLNFRILTSHK